MFLATVLNCTKNIYTSKEKELVRLNDVCYNGETYSIEPVSYTHLDVYKIQVQTTSINLFF